MMPHEQHTDVPNASRINGRELTCVFIVLIAFFICNLATSSRFPLPWQDEVMFTDVAANFAMGQGFVSSVWTCGDNNLDKFFACNAPLFPYMLGTWIRLFGFSIEAVRSLNYFLISISVLLLWLGVRRLNLILRPGYRLLLLPLILTGYGLGINYRSARYDCLGILLICSIFLTYSISRRRLRYCVLFVLATLLPLAGLQLVSFVAIIGVLLLAYLRMQVLKELVSVGFGCVLGGIMLIALFVQHGVMNDFLTNLHRESSITQGYSGFGTQRIPKDPSLFLFYFALLLLAGSDIFARRFKLKSLLGFGIVAGTMVPIGMFVLGKFPTYYSWMAYIPIVVALCASLGSLTARKRPVVAGAVALCIVLGSLTGAPLQMASALYYWRDRESASVDALIARNVGSTDWVYTDYAAYFSVRKRTRYVFIPIFMPSQYKDKISVMVLPPGDFEGFAKWMVGGDWVDVGDSISSTRHDLIQRSFAVLLERRNDLKVYKRLGAQGSSSTLTVK